jgi:hypothetical protein
MPTILKTKNSVTTTVVPTTLQQGELAVNITDKKVWVGNAATTPVQLLGDGGSASFTSIAFGAGTVSAPSITFTGDTNTGIYSPAADTIAFTEGGVESMRISSAGDLGIGSSSPTGKLQVNSSAGAGLVIGESNTSQNRFDANTQIFRTGSFVETMRIDANGFLGIGTSVPITKLTISGSSAASGEIGTLLVTGNTAAKRLAMGVDSTGTMYSWIQSVEAGTAQRLLALQPVGGNVGIGTISAGQKLNIDGGIQLYGGANTRGIYWNMYGVDNDYIDVNGAIDGGIMRFGTSNTERMRINGSGQLLVGTTAAAQGAEKMVVLDTSGNTTLFTKQDGGSSGWVQKVWNSATSGTTNLMEFITETSITARGSITYNRGAGLVAYNTTSDYRSKEIISPVLNSGEVIDSVPVYMGKMKGATQARPMFIAHETPDYAHTGEKDAVDKDGKPIYQQMDASSLVPVLWAEIQSLRKRVAQLESK